MAAPEKRDRLPFEPRSKKKKPSKKPVLEGPAPSNSAYSDENAQLSAIPESVSQRMICRMALFAGIPTALGISSFVIFYWVVSHHWLKVPTSAVVLVSMGLFGLGVLGLSYGILSASWDENRVGGWWGAAEFKRNLGRTFDAWRAARTEAQTRQPKKTST
ncbi:MAG: DUF3464 family protein [Chloroflexaceae bacterium]|nr:DUF3464 family protein [Chloroflexaceae bacterium]